MNEQECISKMIAPGTRRPGKYREGVIQIWVTRHCDKSCYGCTQGSNLRYNMVTQANFTDGREPIKFQQFITPEQFEQAVISLKGYYGVVGVFGGNPAIHPNFEELCNIIKKHIPFEQRGIWSNNPITITNARLMKETFNPAVSNLNVHLDPIAYQLFREGWPQSHPVGLHEDSRHSPPYVAMRDVVLENCSYCLGTGKDPVTDLALTNDNCTVCKGTGKISDDDKIWELISNCDINKHWSAMIGVFRGELRAWFCEIAGAQAMLHQHEPDYPDTGTPIVLTTEQAKEYTLEGIHQWRFKPIEDGVDITPEWFANRSEEKWLKWWELPMQSFTHQVRKHCFDCGIPLRGYGELAQSTSPESVEQISFTHYKVFNPKRKDRSVTMVTDLQQLGTERLQNITKYLQNSKK